MSCQPLKSLVEYWNIGEKNGGIFDIIGESMGLERWCQIEIDISMFSYPKNTF
jgi:hypothetical protein